MKKLPHPPAISIVIPMFNSEKYIGTCIDSILSQTFQDFEVIIIDDCSTDRSAEIVRSFKDPRIRLYRNIVRSRQGYSRNLGISVSRGEFIYFMDSDDEIQPQALEILIEEIGDSEVILMNACIEKRDEVLKYRYCRDPVPRILSPNLIERIRTESINRNVNTESVLRFQRRDFLFKHGICFPLTSRSEDALFNFAEICFAEKIRVVDKCCYIYRIHQESTMRSAPDKQLRHVIRELSESMQFIRRVIQATKISEADKIEIQSEAEQAIMKNFFKHYLRKAYKGELKITEINSIINEEIRENLDPNVFRILFNTLAKELIK